MEISNTNLFTYVKAGLVTIILSLAAVFQACAEQERGRSDTLCNSERHNVLPSITQNQVLRVGTTGDYTPFSYFSKDGNKELVGVDIVMAKDLAQFMGVELNLVKTSWPTLMEDLLADKFDIAMSGVSITSARKQHALFSLPVHKSGKVPITRDENVFKYQTIDDINQPEVRVIVNKGGTNEVFSRKHFSKAQLTVSQENLSVFQKIVDGQADLMVTDRVETLVQQAIHPELSAVNPDTPLNSFNKGYMMVCDPDFKMRVDKWVTARKKDGTMETVFNRELEQIINSAHNAIQGE